ncbi:hypothetical protein [Thiobacter aerophilum]|uniref:Uncharacterized protein n=1 Tax=Thiobacter aerophilum TaxID=3121275 RepID=A0ABV0EEX1_9BURK
MRKLMLWTHRILTALLVLLSLNLIWQGSLEISATTGLVQGSEFGMLITLANQMGGVRVWLGTFALWLMTHPGLTMRKENP